MEGTYYPAKDQYEASHYHVEMSDDDKKTEKSELGTEPLADDKTLYKKTRKLQRTMFESLSVEEQIQLFIWPKNVSVLLFKCKV